MKTTNNYNEFNDLVNDGKEAVFIGYLVVTVSPFETWEHLATNDREDAIVTAQSAAERCRKGEWVEIRTNIESDAECVTSYDTVDFKEA